MDRHLDNYKNGGRLYGSDAARNNYLTSIKKAIDENNIDSFIYCVYISDRGYLMGITYRYIKQKDIKVEITNKTLKININHDTTFVLGEQD